MILGIDPGKYGGLVCMSKSGNVGSYTQMPDTELDVVHWIKSLPKNKQRICFIEKVHAMPKQGVASTFTFGKGYGFLRGVVLSLGFSLEEVHPRVWQSVMKIPTRKKSETQPKFKDRIRHVAQNRYPDLQVWSYTLTAQRAICDALLIAEYGRQMSR